MKIQPSEIVERRFDRIDRTFVGYLYESWKVCEIINSEQPNFSSKFVVNIGAGDGVECNDPCYPLYKIGYGGLAIEGEKNELLHKNLSSENITTLTNTFINPFNAGALLQQHKTPVNFDMLKIDIDGYDGPVLDAILSAGYRPKLIQAEINHEIPPPIEFSVMYHSIYKVHDSDGMFSPFYGMSLSFLAKIARKFGYHIAYLDNITPLTHDAILIRNDLSEIVGSNLDMTNQSIEKMYYDHPPTGSHFLSYGINPFEWRDEKDKTKLANSVWIACFASSVKKFNGAYPFYFSIAE
ncbi:hypothetical protein [Azospirillum doebereinerae]|uniref:FkbM family methyltransferase n=1 Tax=Azospirillum doebereinerae TaxID=92933 RepID=A0A3S0VHJ8_9PROT|nr:hypothetical protein [Azospirillum doebereinerae]MCG5241861.1 hypothetical protein [Azospirillum doebereinerae]RUQ69382.1 hypothetical protein EJ913_16600 [Azospirillum doebereinerae]